MPRTNKGAKLHWRKDKGKWEIRWFVKGNKRSKSTGTTDRADAEKALAAFLIEEEPIGPNTPDNRMIADSLHFYLLEKAPELADPARPAYAVDKLIPFWGDLVVGDIKESTCRAYARQRDASDGTIRKELGTLRAAVNYDYKQGRLTAPAPVWLPNKPKNKERWLTRQEVAHLLWAARKGEKGAYHLSLFIMIGLYTGQRKEAILSLRWPQIDLKRGLIDFNPKGREETAKKRPIQPIPRRLSTFLHIAKRHIARDKNNYIDELLTGFVLTWNNKQIKDIKKGFHATAIRAGLCIGYKKSKSESNETKEGYPVTWVHPLTDVTPHVLRHTTASWLIQNGVSFIEAAKFLGHTDTRTTEQTYAHHAPDFLENASSALDKRRGQ